MVGSDATRDRVFGLDHARSAVLALVCAQALVRDNAPSDAELNEAIGRGWEVARTQRSESSDVDSIRRRPDIDADAVAATFYALRAVGGSTEDSWWAVSRFVDAAFERARYRSGASRLRSLARDAALPEVRAQLDQLEEWLRAAESSLALGDLISHLEHY